MNVMAFAQTKLSKSFTSIWEMAHAGSSVGCAKYSRKDYLDLSVTILVFPSAKIQDIVGVCQQRSLLL